MDKSWLCVRYVVKYGIDCIKSTVLYFKRGKRIIHLDIHNFRAIYIHFLMITIIQTYTISLYFDNNYVVIYFRNITFTVFVYVLLYFIHPIILYWLLYNGTLLIGTP